MSAVQEQEIKKQKLEQEQEPAQELVQETVQEIEQEEEEEEEEDEGYTEEDIKLGHELIAAVIANDLVRTSSLVHNKDR